MGWFAGLMAIALASSAPQVAPQDLPGDERLHGVWQVVEWHDYAADGSDRFAGLPVPQGRFTYTPAGNMAVQVMLDPVQAPIAGSDDEAELAHVMRNTIEYFGRFEADPASGLLIHRIEGAGLPNRRGRAERRGYEIDGDTLVISWAAEDGRSWYRRLERIEDL